MSTKAISYEVAVGGDTARLHWQTVSSAFEPFPTDSTQWVLDPPYSRSRHRVGFVGRPLGTDLNRAIALASEALRAWRSLQDRAEELDKDSEAFAKWLDALIP